MTFKDKIIAAIKLKFPKVNLSKKRLDAIAAKIEEEIIDDETKIDATIDAFNKYNPLEDIAKNDDTLRSLEKKVKEPANPKKEVKTEPEVKPAAEEVVDDGTPAWAKALIDSNKQLQSDLAVLKGEKTAQTIRTEATKKLTDIPVSYWAKRTLPEKEEDLDAFVTEVQADYQAFAKEMTEKGLGNIPTPGSGGAGSGKGDGKGAGGGGDKATKEEIADITKDIMQ